MQVRVLVDCDSRAKSAMFQGQVYDLPLDEAEALIAGGRAERLTVAKAQEPVANKAVEAPPSNKGANKRRDTTKRKRG